MDGHIVESPAHDDGLEALMAALGVEVWRVPADDVDPLDTWIARTPAMPEIIGTGWTESEAREAWWIDWIERERSNG